MRKIRRSRRQRVTFRFKRREQLKTHVRTIVLRTTALAIIVGGGAWLMTGGDSIAVRFMRAHTPQFGVNSPQTLTGLPLAGDLPTNRLWLWFPGSGYWVEKRVCRQYTAVRGVWLERHYLTNKVVAHLVPRVPLVTWNGAGFDCDGMLFAITPGTWNVLPQASFLAAAHKKELGQWLAKLAAVPEVWSQILSIRQSSPETLELTLKTGTIVIWGSAENESLTRKAQTLVRVLDDAHKNMGGTARADLRFFDQGRIIVRPKSVKG